MNLHPKQLPFRRALRTTRRHVYVFSILIGLLLLAIAFSSSAQQRGQDPAGQRPRRVTPSTTPAPSPAKTPATNDGEEVSDDEVVRIETQLVSVPAVVTSSSGRPVANLKAEDFRLFEDGKLQSISNFATAAAPFEVALLLDTSGSTRADVALIRRAANAFIDALRPGDRVALIAFNTSKEEESSLATVEVLSMLTSDRETLRRSLEDVGSSNGTPFYDALGQIADEVFHDPPREEVRGRRAIVALTDGVDSASTSEYDAARVKLLNSGVAVYFIQVNTEDFVEDRLLSDCRDDGALRLSKTQLLRYRRLFVPKGDDADYADFCQLGSFERMQISRNLYNLARKEMTEIARLSGGRNFSAVDLSDARRAFAQVATEIGTQYSLGYYPTNKAHDGSFRQIRVEVKGVAGAQVRAREGYVAPKS